MAREYFHAVMAAAIVLLFACGSAVAAGGVEARSDPAGHFYYGDTLTLPDGRKVRLGQFVADADRSHVFGIEVFDRSGNPDPAFNGNGFNTATIWGYYENADQFVLQADGKIVVEGYAANPAFKYNTQCYPADCGIYPAFARFNADGTLDTSFNGSHGRIILEFGDWSAAESDALVPPVGVGLDAAGKIVLYTGDAGPGTPAARLNPDGTLDSTFSSAYANPVQEVIFYGEPSMQVQGLWWDPGSPGWAINLAHQGNTVFATWMTYNGEQPAWLSATMKRVDASTYTGTIYRTAAARSDSAGLTAYGPVARVVEAGTASLFFFGEKEAGLFAYNLDNVQALSSIQREAFGTVPKCTWDPPEGLAAATNYTDTWWNPSQPGWAINLAHQDDTIFATWLLYDSEGAARWLTGIFPRDSTGKYSGNLYITSRTPSSSVSYAVTAHVAGTASLAFASGNDATFTVSLDGAFWDSVTGSVKIQRQVFEGVGTSCK
ncbi:MAG TPA: hypothetical protein VLT60_05420 [Usitatibacter sp.]|nr:hypothetical protein [Usitatibacter sp.]